MGEYNAGNYVLRKDPSAEVCWLCSAMLDFSHIKLVLVLNSMSKLLSHDRDVNIIRIFL